MKLREDFTCPLEVVHDFVKGKWKTIIIFQLRNGRKSLSELKRSIKGITEKMLLEDLKELKEYGIIDKETFDGYPLRVEYFLTEKRGSRMLEAIRIMQDIGIDYLVEQGKEEELLKKGIKCKVL